MTLGKGGKGKANVNASTMWQNVSVKVEDIRICVERCCKKGVGGKGLREWWKGLNGPK
jgi:hypothetical protein